MGLFRKKKTYVSTTFVSMIDQVPNILARTVTSNIIKNNPLVESTLDAYCHGLGANLTSYYNYGKNNYTRGLPEGTLNYTKPSEMQTLLAIQNDIDTAVIPFTGKASLATVHVDICDTEHLIIQYLDETYGYEPETQELLNPPFTPVDTVTYSDHTLVNDTTITLHLLDGLVPVDVNITLATQRSGLYVHATYFLHQNTTQLGASRNWSYRIGEGRYPKLDSLKGYTQESKYYPIVPFREHNVNLADDDTTDLYKTSKRALNRLNIDFDDVCTGIHENPDIDDVDHAYFMVGANIQSEEVMTQKYLYKFFKYLSGTALYDKLSYEDYLADPDRLLPEVNTFNISDGQLNITLNYSYIDITQSVGSIGDVETVTRTTNVLPRKQVSHSEDYRSGGNSYTRTQYYYYEDSELVFQYQLTENTYETVTVKGLLHINNIYNNHSVETTLEESLDEDLNNLIIPLNYDLVNEFGLVERTQLVQDCILIIFNSYVVQKLKWYQSGFFQFVVLVLAVAIMVYTGQGWIAEIADKTLIAATAYMAEQIVIGYVLSLGFSFVVEHVGLEVALIVGTLLAVYGGIGATKTLSTEGLPFAEELLMAANGLMSGVKDVAADTMTDIMNEMALLEADYESFMEDLEEVQETLDGTNLINPNIFIQPTETVDTYLERTIYSGNIGEESIELVTNYVELQLELPQ